jgi:hypothetical protein
MEHSWEIRLVLKKQEVPLGWLGNSVWIGWSSWLGARLTDQDAADYSNTQGRHLPHWEPQPGAKTATAPEPEHEPQLVE